jgi:hypothetical protein
MTKLWVVCPSIRFAPNQINEPPHGEYIVNYSEMTLVYLSPAWRARPSMVASQ